MRKVHEMKKLIVMITGAMLFSSVAMANAHHKNKTMRVQAEVTSSIQLHNRLYRKFLNNSVVLLMSNLLTR